MIKNWNSILFTGKYYDKYEHWEGNRIQNKFWVSKFFALPFLLFSFSPSSPSSVSTFLPHLPLILTSRSTNMRQNISKERQRNDEKRKNSWKFIGKWFVTFFIGKTFKCSIFIFSFFPLKLLLFIFVLENFAFLFTLNLDNDQNIIFLFSFCIFSKLCFYFIIQFIVFIIMFVNQILCHSIEIHLFVSQPSFLPLLANVMHC